MIIPGNLHILMYSLLLLTTACKAGVSSLNTQANNKISGGIATPANFELLSISGLVTKVPFAYRKAPMVFQS